MMFPFLFLAPWTGVWVDRLDRKKLLRVTQSLAMTIAFTLAFLVQSDAAQLWHVYLLAVLLGCVNAFDFPTHMTFVGDLSGVADTRRGIMLNNIVFQSSRLLGPTLAGFLIGAVGLPIAFWINGISYLAVILTLSRISVHSSPVTRRKKSLHEFLEGLRFIRNHPHLQYLFAFSALVTFLFFSSHQIMAAYVSKVLQSGPNTLGVLLGASGFGALVGSLMITPVAQRSEKIGRTLTLACSWTGLWLIVLASSRTLSLSLFAMASAAIAIPVVLTTASGLIQTLAAEGMRGRLLSAWMMVVLGVQPLAAFLVGLFADYVGVAIAIGLNGILLVIGAMVLLGGSPDLRKWRTTPPSSEREAGANV